MLPFLLASVLSVTAAQAECPASASSLSDELGRAYSAYTAFELESFEARAASSIRRAECLEGLIAPELAVQLHLVAGLAAWLDQDPRSMAAAVRGVYALEPDFEPGVEVAPEGSRIRAVFDTARAGEPGPSQAVVGPELRVDGRPVDAGMPLERAALVQWTTRDGTVRSWYLDGLGLPSELVDELALAAPSAPHPRHRSRGLVAAGGVALVAGTGALWGAHAARQAYWDSYTLEEEQRYYRLNRSLSVSGYGLLSLGSLGAVGAVVLWEF